MQAADPLSGRSAGGTDQRSDTSGAPFEFDIPSQPLSTALDRFAGTTHLSIVIPSDMVRDRISARVRGRMTADDALQQLLAGTGLEPERQAMPGGTAYILKPAAVPVPRVGRAALIDRPAYAGMVQSRIWQALCDDARTAPGDYRLVFEFRLDPAGHVDDPHLYTSTGDTGRDAAVLRALRRVQVDPPPAELASQSMIMSLLPDGQADAPRCAAGAR
jgi:TonB family protein